MSWMAVNNAPLLGTGATDISGLSEGFRDGQKLRQEYEARQQQKALNEIMRTQDHAGRLDLARQHKYAGALVPLLQKYDEDRQKAALDNLKTSADIGKTYGETGKLNQEAGEIGAKTQGQVIKNLAEKYSGISAGALTRDRKLFAMMLGDYQNAGLINPEHKGQIIDMMVTDPEGAVAVMQRIARGSLETFKATAPEAKVLDAKDAAYMYTINPYTGEASKPTQKVAYGQSPDNFADNEAKKYVSNNSLEGTKYSSDNSLTGTKYSSDNSYNASVYGTDSRAETASEQAAVSWYKAENKAIADAENAKTNRIKAQSGTVGANGQPVRKLNTTEQKKLFEIQDQQNADKSVIQTLDKMMKLVDSSYSGVAASGRAKGMSNIGLGGERADNTVLYDNLATSQALAQLKSTFGAAPTEGERKILMDIQASASKTPMQKKQIIAQAFRAVQARQAYREKLANGIRTGQYMIPTTPTTTKPAGKTQKKQNSAGASIIGGILGGG